MKPPKRLFSADRISSRSYERALKQSRRRQETITKTGPDGTETKCRVRLKVKPDKRAALGKLVSLIYAPMVSNAPTPVAGTEG